MRNRIWTELTQSKFNEEFTSLYIDRQRMLLRYFNIGILIFSTGGAMGWSIWDKIPTVACVIIAAVSILRLIQPQLIMSEKQISNLDTIQKFYADYYNRLEKLWFDLEKDVKDELQGSDIFFEIKQTELEINPLINEVIRTKPQKIVKKASDNAISYLNKVFYTNSD